MKRLKVDLHTHTADDPYDRLGYSAEELIDAAAARGVDVLAITCHELNPYTESLRAYAQRQGLLLIPGIEKYIELRHVVILNPNRDHLQAQTFADLRAIGRGDAAFIAPHPYYPTPNSLMGQLVPNIDLFDGVEWCSLYLHGLNLNWPAARVAKRFGLPMIGTSDTHGLPYDTRTFSWIDAEPTLAGVIEAIRAGRIVVETKPWRPLKALRFAARSVAHSIRSLTRNSGVTEGMAA